MDINLVVTVMMIIQTIATGATKKMVNCNVTN